MGSQRDDKQKSKTYSRGDGTGEVSYRVRNLQFVTESTPGETLGFKIDMRLFTGLIYRPLPPKMNNFGLKETNLCLKLIFVKG